MQAILNTRFYFWTWCLIVCCFCMHSTAQNTNSGSCAIAFYNLENFFNPEDNPLTDDDDFTPEGKNRYTEKVFEQKASNMARAIAALAKDVEQEGPALIGICEVEDDKAIKKMLSMPVLRDKHYRFVRFDGPDHRGINVALLYRSPYFKLIHAQSLHIDLKHLETAPTRDILFVKGVLLGDTVFVFINHWPARSGGQAASEPKRKAAAAVNKNAINQILAQNPKAKIILMGDLNDDPINASIQEVLGATSQDSKALEQNLLFNPWFEFYQKGIGSLCYQDRWNLFDQILLSAAWLDPHVGIWHYDKARVFNEHFLRTVFGKYKGYPHRSYSGSQWINGYSDHFPTIIYLKKNP